MAMVPVYNPPDGDVTAPINGMSVGKSVYVFGKIAEDADKFMVDLMCGDDQKVSLIALHLNASFPANQLIWNNRINGVWDEEKIARGFPFTKGDYFSFKITCKENDLVVTANDVAVEIHQEHQLPPNMISHVFVGQQCQAILITSEIDGEEIPALTISKPKLESYLLPFYNIAGRKIQIVGTPTKLKAVEGPFSIMTLILDICCLSFTRRTKTGQGFAINLLAEDNQIIFHYQPIGAVGEIVRNTQIDGAWGEREKSLEIDFPFKNSVQFQTTISITEKEFVVDINGTPAFTYANRVEGGIGRIRNLQISPTVQLESIKYF